VFNIELGCFSLVNLTSRPFYNLKDSQYCEILKNYCVDLKNFIEIKISDKIFITVTPDLLMCSECSTCISDLSEIYLREYNHIFCLCCFNKLDSENANGIKKFSEIMTNLKEDYRNVLEEFRDVKNKIINEKAKEYDSLLNLVKKEILKSLEDEFDKSHNIGINEKLKNFKLEFKEKSIINAPAFLEKRLIDDIQNFEQCIREEKIKINNANKSNQDGNFDESFIVSDDKKLIIENLAKYILDKQKNIEDYKILNHKTNIPFIAHGLTDETLTIEDEFFNLRLNDSKIINENHFKEKSKIKKKSQNKSYFKDKKNIGNSFRENNKKNSSMKYNDINNKFDIENSDLTRRLDLSYEINFDGSDNVIHLFDIPNFIAKEKDSIVDFKKAFPGVKILQLMKDSRNKKAHLAKLFIDCDKILDYFICLPDTFEIIISQYSLIVGKEVHNGYAQLICTKWKKIVPDKGEEYDLIDLTNS
jgi:hypothetical protein